jgi:hypothetical protein
VTTKFKSIMFSVILIVLCLLMLPLVIDGVTDALAITSISNYAGVEAFIGLIPLLVVVGMVVVAIFNGIMAIKSKN